MRRIVKDMNDVTLDLMALEEDEGWEIYNTSTLMSHDVRKNPTEDDTMQYTVYLRRPRRAH